MSFPLCVASSVGHYQCLYIQQVHWCSTSHEDVDKWHPRPQSCARSCSANSVTLPILRLPIVSSPIFPTDCNAMLMCLRRFVVLLEGCSLSNDFFSSGRHIQWVFLESVESLPSPMNVEFVSRGVIPCSCLVLVFIVSELLGTYIFVVDRVSSWRLNCYTISYHKLSHNGLFYHISHIFGDLVHLHLPS